MKPMLKYRGGKQRELSEILHYMPNEYERYIEPFFGGGALFFYLEPKEAIINDLNSNLMRFYEDVQMNYDAVQKDLTKLHQEYEANRKKYEQLKAKTPHERVPDENEKRYYQLRDMYNGLTDSEFTWGALYFYINKTAYSGMIRYNKNGEFNVPYGRYKHLAVNGVTNEHHQLLQHTNIMSGDYQSVFNLCKPDDFVFLDPPYDCIFTDYGNPELNNGFTPAEHKRLAEAFFELPCPALLVIGETELTGELYKGQIIHEYEKSYSVNIRNRFKSESRHILVSNQKGDHRCQR